MAALLQKVHEVFPILFELLERVPIVLHYLLDGFDILVQPALILILSSYVSLQLVKIRVSCTKFEGSYFNASYYLTHLLDLLERGHEGLNYIR